MAANNEAPSETIRHLLADLGFGTTEALVYDYGARQVEPVRVQDIQRYTALKRTTIYYALEQLTSRGIVSSAQGERATEYAFQPPAKLEQLVHDEVRLARAKLHSVAKLIDIFPHATETKGLKVSQFEGLQGVKTVIDMTLYCKSLKWQVIAPFKNFLSDYDEQYGRYYVYTKRRHGIETQTLWEKVMPDSRRLSPNEVKEKNPRIMPAAMLGKFESILIIFDNKIAIIAPYSEMTAVVIESDEIASMFRGFYEIIWSVSTPYADAVKKSPKN